MMRIGVSVAAAIALCAAGSARADEGMWTFDNFPAAKVQKGYGFTPTQGWLDEARLSAVRLAGGCSASFVSAEGLIMTNHHCAHSCIEQLSTATHDFVKTGFKSAARADEVKCPEIEANELLGITDVTARVRSATKGMAGAAFGQAQRAETSRIESECAHGDKGLRCDVVELYHGGVFSLYKYKRFQDVRLVFAPEFAIAFFGGDPDNFTFPRYDLDVAFLRAYEDGKPAQTPHHLRWSHDGAKDGELTFVAGHPGSTQRELTVAELAYQRDYAVPERLMELAQYRGAVTEFMRRGPEQHRIAEAELFYVENAYKAFVGRRSALVDPKLMADKVREERELRERSRSIPALAGDLDGWDQVARATELYRGRRAELSAIEYGRPLGTRLFSFARTLVRYAEERSKPSDQRLREYRDSALPQLQQGLTSRAPIYPEYEAFKARFALTRLREVLGADHPFVRKVLGNRSPEQLAEELVKGTKLADPAVRENLFAHPELIARSNDPMIQLALKTDADARAIRKWAEDQVESPEREGSEKVARAKFAIQGKGTYPDATFTLRLSYGAVKGYREPDGRTIAPFTTFAGAFQRATGAEPFALPDSWLAAKSKLDLNAPFNFATTNDIIGGNSGSPVFNKDREVVGLIFDGNIESLGGDYFFDPAVNRAVAVTSQALLMAVDRIYDAHGLAQELRGSSTMASVK